jgi:hypothetical protein
MDLLTTSAHHSELQIITALSLSSTIHKSLHVKSSPECIVFKSRFLGTASNSGDSSASRAQVVLAQLPVQDSCQLSNPAIAPPLLSLPCGAQLNCQPSSFTSLHFTSLHFTSLRFTQLNCPQPVWYPRYIPSGRTQQKTSPPTVPLLLLLAVA